MARRMMATCTPAVNIRPRQPEGARGTTVDGKPIARPAHERTPTGTTQDAVAVYLLVDTSGSTVRDGFSAACNQVLPGVVEAVGQRTGALFSLLSFGTAASVLVRLSDPASIRVIPPLIPSGLSSLVAGLRLLAGCIDEDARQLSADGIGWRPPFAFVLADGLPTDPDVEVLAAREALDDFPAGTTARLHAALPGDTARLAVAGLRMIFHPLLPATSADLPATILAAIEHSLKG